MTIQELMLQSKKGQGFDGPGSVGLGSGGPGSFVMIVGHFPLDNSPWWTIGYFPPWTFHPWR